MPGKSELGVLFVHGIGGQRQGDTLIRFGEPLYRWLDGWLSHGAPTEEHPVSIAETNLKPGPAEPASLRLAAGWPEQEGGERDWLLAESWWATSFEAPGAAGVALWAAGFGPRTISRIIDRRLKANNAAFKDGLQEAAEAEGLGGAVSGWWLTMYVIYPAWALTTLALGLGAVLLDLALWAVLLLAFLPLSLVRPLRPLLTRLQLLLSNVFGDTYVLERSPFAFAAMTAAVQRDLDWLEARAEKLVVVAHSQGSVIAHRALRERPRDSVALFVTVGSALNLLAEGEAEGEGEESEGPRPLRSADGSALEWVDLFAARDPVSDGPLWRGDVPEGATTIRVHNYDSMLRDHTGYWRNLDEFVAQLAVRLTRLTGADAAAVRARDRRSLRRAPLHRERRVAALAVARYLTAAAALAAAGGLGVSGLRDVGRFLGGPVGWVGGWFGADSLGDFSAALAVLVGIAALLIAALGLHLLTLLAGNRWEREAARAMYRRSPAPAPLRARAFFAAPASAAVLAAAGIALAAHGVNPLTIALAVVALVVAVVFVRFVDSADRPPSPQPLPPPATIEEEDLAQGEEYVFRDGESVRRVELVDLKPPDFELMLTPLDTRKVKVRFLDDPPSSSRHPKDETVLVGPRKLLYPWEEYAAWEQRREQKRAEWKREEDLAREEEAADPPLPADHDPADAQAVGEGEEGGGEGT